MSMTPTQKQNVPALRFPEFSGEWEKAALGSIAKFASGGTPSKGEPKYWDGEIPWISAASMHSDVIEESEYHVTELGARNGTKLAEKDTVLLLVRGSMLFNRIPAGICARTVAFNQDVKALSVSRSDFGHYLLLYIRAAEHRLLSLVTGTGIGAGKLDTDELKSLPFPRPTLPEQQKITAFLSSVDRKIAQLGEKKALLQDYKKGCTQKLFSQQLRFKDAQGDDFPDWEEKRLGEIAKVNPKASKLPEEFIYIDLESVVSGSLVKESKIQKAGAPSRAQRLLEKGDVLFQTVRPYQKNNYYFFKDGDYVASTGYAQLRAVGPVKFLYQILHTDSFVNKVLARCTGTSYPAINSNDLAKIHFQLPIQPEQQKIADFLSSIDRKIDLVATELDHAKTFKKGLLQQMFV